jgi:hypothetical protein
MERENGKAIKTQIIITYTMVTILTIKNTGKVYLHGQAETFTKAITKMMIAMETDKWYGQTEACMRENGKMEYSMALEKWYLLMGQAKRGILKIMYLNMHYHRMIKISKIALNKIKKAFSNKKSKCKWDQLKQAHILMVKKKQNSVLIKKIN